MLFRSMAPVLVFSVRPAGRVPTTENVYGEVPPLTDMGAVFSAAPTSPELTVGQAGTGAVVTVTTTPVPTTENSELVVLAVMVVEPGATPVTCTLPPDPVIVTFCGTVATVG